MALICPPRHSEARGKTNMGLSSSYLETNPWGRCPGDDNRGLSHFCVKRRNGASRLICEVNWQELKSTCCDGFKQFENLTNSSTNSQRYEMHAELDHFWKSSYLGRIWQMIFVCCWAWQTVCKWSNHSQSFCSWGKQKYSTGCMILYASSTKNLGNPGFWHDI